MKNYIKSGATITVTATADVVSGEAHFVGDMFGVAQDSAVTGEDYEFLRCGEFELLTPTAVTASVGVKAYWLDNGTGVTGSATASKLVGKFTKANINGDIVAHVVLTE